MEKEPIKKNPYEGLENLDSKEQRRQLWEIERQLVERRRQIISKLSEKDQEELAQVDFEWDEYKEIREKLGQY